MEKYLALYWQHHVMEQSDFDTLDSAINFLIDGADNGYLLQVAVIDRDSKEILWQANIFPKDEIWQVNKFIKKHYES